jgi:hypothetical protein
VTTRREFVVSETSGIRTAQSCACDARDAVEEFFAGVAQPGMSLVIFFCSSSYDREAVAAEMARHFTGIPVIGCTTAGEIGPAGCVDGSLTGVSFSAGACTAVTRSIEGLQQFEIGAGQAVARDLLEDLDRAETKRERRSRFAFLLVDGLSAREELVAYSVQEALGEIPVVGGSAGDALSFASTHVYSGGRFLSDAAVLALVSTPMRVKTFKTQHFVPTEERLVVTEAEPSRRVVKELNGLPAAEEYARLLGVDADDLAPIHFAAAPVVVLIDGANYVRSIQKANPDGSLTFYCAIERGVVLREATGMDLVTNLEQALARVRAEVGDPALILACDCILRKLEIAQDGLQDRVGEILRRHNTVGFNTYGEQFGGVHVNQTLTGIALGAAPTAADDA